MKSPERKSKVVQLSVRARSRRLPPRDGDNFPTTQLRLPATEEALFELHDAIGKMEKALPPPRYFRAVIFGSARVDREDPIYKETREIARRLSERGIDIVTGGGPGIMEAASCGAMDGAKKSPNIRSWGICIESVYGRVEPPNEYLSRAYQHGNFFTRLHQFARLGAMGAFIVLPGGIGTLLELAMIWQLLQVRHLSGCPLIVADPMWHEIIDVMRRQAVPRGHVRSDEVDQNVKLVSSASEALPLVFEAYGRFKKMRAAG